MHQFSKPSNGCECGVQTKGILKLCFLKRQKHEKARYLGHRSRLWLHARQNTLPGAVGATGYKLAQPQPRLTRLALAQNLDFGVDCDSRVAIVGPNGAGGTAVTDDFGR